MKNEMEILRCEEAPLPAEAVLCLHRFIHFNEDAEVTHEIRVKKRAGVAAPHAEMLDLERKRVEGKERGEAPPETDR